MNDQTTKTPYPGNGDASEQDMELDFRDLQPEETAAPQSRPLKADRGSANGAGSWAQERSFASSPFMDARVSGEGHHFAEKLHFPVATKKSRRDIVLDLGQSKYLISGASIRSISSVREASRSLYYLSDFPMAPLGLLNVSSEHRYAHIMARKELEDRGDLTPEGKLWIYSKKKVDEAQSKILYQIFPQQRFAALTQQYTEYKHGFDLYETVGLLINSLTSGDRSRVQVRALHLDNAITLVVGTKNEVLQVRRYTLAGPDDISLGEGINALQQDMVSLQENIGIKIDHITWIEGLMGDLDISIPETTIPLELAPVTELRSDEGRTFWSALPGMMTSLSLKNSLIPEEMRFSRPLEKFEPLLWALCATLVLSLGVGAYMYAAATSNLKERVSALTAQAAQIQSENADVERSIATLLQDASMDIPHFMNVASSLSRASTAPSCGKFWNAMAGIRPENTRLDSFSLNYDQDKVAVRLAGDYDQAMISAQENFTKYIQRIKSMGFNIVEQQLDSGLSSSRFSLHIEWPLLRSAS
jgi:hypothetical protein